MSRAKKVIDQTTGAMRLLAYSHSLRQKKYRAKEDDMLQMGETYVGIFGQTKKVPVYWFAQRAFGYQIYGQFVIDPRDVPWVTKRISWPKDTTNGKVPYITVSTEYGGDMRGAFSAQRVWDELGRPDPPLTVGFATLHDETGYTLINDKGEVLPPDAEHFINMDDIENGPFQP